MRVGDGRSVRLGLRPYEMAGDRQSDGPAVASTALDRPSWMDRIGMAVGLRLVECPFVSVPPTRSSGFGSVDASSSGPGLDARSAGSSPTRPSPLFDGGAVALTRLDWAFDRSSISVAQRRASVGFDGLSLRCALRFHCAARRTARIQFDGSMARVGLTFSSVQSIRFASCDAASIGLGSCVRIKCYRRDSNRRPSASDSTPLTTKTKERYEIRFSRSCISKVSDSDGQSDCIPPPAGPGPRRRREKCLSP